MQLVSIFILVQNIIASNTFRNNGDVKKTHRERQTIELKTTDMSGDRSETLVSPIVCRNTKKQHQTHYVEDKAIKFKEIIEKKVKDQLHKASNTDSHNTPIHIPKKLLMCVKTSEDAVNLAEKLVSSVNNNTYNNSLPRGEGMKQALNENEKQKNLQKIQDVKQNTTDCNHVVFCAKNEEFLNLDEKNTHALYYLIHKHTLKSEKFFRKLLYKLKRSNYFSKKNFMNVCDIDALDLLKDLPSFIPCNQENNNLHTKANKNIQDILKTGCITFNDIYHELDKISFDCDISLPSDLNQKLHELMLSFLNDNIATLSVVLPQMRYFMAYYNEYKCETLSCKDLNHAFKFHCLTRIIGIMLTSLKAVVDEIRHDVNEIHSKSEMRQSATFVNQTFYRYSHYMLTKFEMEKMLLYTLEIFLPADKFSYLVNLHHMSLRSALANLQDNKNIKSDCPRISYRALRLLRLLDYAFLHIEYPIEDGRKEISEVKKVFFIEELLNESVLKNIQTGMYLYLKKGNIHFYIQIFSVFVLANKDKLDNGIRTRYNYTAQIYNFLITKESKLVIERPDLNKYQTKMIEQIEPQHQNRLDTENNDILHYIKANPIDYSLRSEILSKNAPKNCVYGVIYYIMYTVCNSIIKNDPLAAYGCDLFRSDAEHIKIIDENLQILKEFKRKPIVAVGPAQKDFYPKKSKRAKEKTTHGILPKKIKKRNFSECQATHDEVEQMMQELGIVIKETKTHTKKRKSKCNDE